MLNSFGIEILTAPSTQINTDHCLLCPRVSAVSQRSQVGFQLPRRLACLHPVGAYALGAASPEEIPEGLQI